MTRVRFTARERNALGIALARTSGAQSVLTSDERQALRELHAKMDSALSGQARRVRAARRAKAELRKRRKKIEEQVENARAMKRATRTIYDGWTDY